MINFLRWKSPPSPQPIPGPPLRQPQPQFHNMPPRQLEQQIAREQQRLTIYEQQLTIQGQQLMIEEQQLMIEEQQRRIDEQQRRIDEQQQNARLNFDYIQMAGQMKGTTKFINHFKKNQMPTDQPDCFGRTLLHCAVHYQDIASVKFLLGQHVNSRDKEVMYVNSRDMEGLTALHYGAHQGNIEAVKALLQTEGVNPNLGDQNGVTALHYAARAGKIEAVKALLEAKEVNPNPGDKKGMTPLHYASYNASFEVVEALIASYEARGKKMDVNESANGEGSLSRKKPMELATLSTSSDYKKIRTMALLYKYGGKIEGEEFFKNLDGNEWISKDLKENIIKLSSQERESVDKFIFEKDKEEDDKTYEKIKSTKEIAPSPVVYLDTKLAKKARIEVGQQSEGRHRN